MPQATVHARPHCKIPPSHRNIIYREYHPAAVGRQVLRRQQSAVPVGVGGMAAIIGLTDEAVEKACAEAAEGEVVEPVNFNSPGQVVIAGNTAAVARACEKCKAAGAKRALPLAVSGPFHSKLLAGAAEKLGVRLSEVEV